MLDLLRARNISPPIDEDEVLEKARAMLAGAAGRVAESAPPYAARSPRPDAAGSRRTGHEPRGRRHTRPGEDDSLPDHPPRPGGALLVGINPAPASVARGHYYQGKQGRRLWKHLESIGVLTTPLPGHEDEALVAAGHGLTDLGKRVTARASDLRPGELAGGVDALRAKIHEWQPGLVVFVYKGTAVPALGRRDVSPGPCGEVAGVRAFLLPGPYAASAEVARVYADLQRLLRR
jgi:TDG/mug DNA glycosylase family protein